MNTKLVADFLFEKAVDASKHIYSMKGLFWFVLRDAASQLGNYTKKELDSNVMTVSGKFGKTEFAEKVEYRYSTGLGVRKLELFVENFTDYAPEKNFLFGFGKNSMKLTFELGNLERMLIENAHYTDLYYCSVKTPLIEWHDSTGFDHFNNEQDNLYVHRIFETNLTSETRKMSAENRQKLRKELKKIEKVENTYTGFNYSSFTSVFESYLRSAECAEDKQILADLIKRMSQKNEEEAKRTSEQKGSAGTKQENSGNSKRENTSHDEQTKQGGEQKNKKTEEQQNKREDKQSSTEKDEAERPKMVFTSTSYYEDLHVSPQATQVEIARAYRQEMKKYHSDLNGESKKNHEMAVKINRAYEALKHEDTRKAYDEFLKTTAFKKGRSA